MSKLAIKQCKICGAGFVPYTGRTATCSKACSIKLNCISCEAKRKEKYRTNESFRTMTIKKSCESQLRKRIELRNSKTKICNFCGSVFKPSTSFHANCCSEKCRSSLKKRQDAIRNKTPERRKKHQEYITKRYFNDPVFRLRKNVSRQISLAIKMTGSVKGGSCLRFLTYTIPQLKKHLESFFNNSNGFTWENHGSAWHIDHIIPQSYFRYTSLDSKLFRDCWDLSNLIPVNREFNHSKGDRFIGSEKHGGQLVFIAS